MLRIENKMVLGLTIIILAKSKQVFSMMANLSMVKERERAFKELQKTSTIRENFIMIINMGTESNMS